MKDYHSILGVAQGASQDDIKKAYRKLAQQHHPDKEGGDEEKFKEIKEAYEKLSNPQPESPWQNARGPGFTEMDEILRQMREAHMRAQENMVHMVGLRVDIRRAFEGCTIPLGLGGQSIAYNLRAGLPQHVQYIDEVPFGDRTRKIQIQLIIDGGPFRFVRPGSTDGIFFSGDLETDISVDALDLLCGGYVVVEDFLGKKLQVRIPAGFDLGTRLKVAKHGYHNWRGDDVAERGDLYLKVTPKFRTLQSMEEKDLDRLHTAVNDEYDRRADVTKSDAVTD